MIRLAKWIWLNRPNSAALLIGSFIIAIAIVYGNVYHDGAWILTPRPPDALNHPLAWSLAVYIWISPEQIELAHWMAMGVGATIMLTSLWRGAVSCSLDAETKRRMRQRPGVFGK